MTRAYFVPIAPKEGPRRLPAHRRPQVPHAYRVEVEGVPVGEVYQRTRETCRHLSSGVRYNIRHSLKWYYCPAGECFDTMISHDTRQQATDALLRDVRPRGG